MENKISNLRVALYKITVIRLNNQNLKDSSSLMISLKLGLLMGSLSQHLRINLARLAGTLSGIVGLRSLAITSLATLLPLISIK